MDQKPIEQIIYEETEQRLKIMQDKNYVFPEKINGLDMFGIFACLVISIILIVGCTTGVIV